MTKNEPCIFICRGVNVQYRARVRFHGFRRYRVLAQWTPWKHIAMKQLTEAMDTGNYKRGDLLMAADYYDPEVIYEIVRR